MVLGRGGGYGGGTPYWTLTDSRSHLTSCPLHLRSYELRIGFFIVFWLRQTIRVLLHFSLRLEVGGRGSAISPSLTFRPVIRWDAPILQLVKFDKILGGQGQNGVLISEENIVAAIRKAERSIFEFFQQGKASPFDMTENGLSLVHVGLTNFLFILVKFVKFYANISLRSLRYGGHSPWTASGNVFL